MHRRTAPKTETKQAGKPGLFKKPLHEKIHPSAIREEKKGLLLTESEITAVLEAISNADAPLIKIRRTRGRSEEECKNLTELEQKLQLPYSVLITQSHKLMALYEGKSHLLGSGGFGKVKLAQDLQTGEWVAIKIQPITTRFKNRIDTEINISTQLGFQRDGLERKSDHGSKAYSILELIRGTCLANTSITSFEEKLHVLISTLIKLKEIHNKNIFHGDFKPENVMYDPNNKQITIIDFGCSEKMTEDKSEAFAKDLRSFESTFGMYVLCNPCPDATIDDVDFESDVLTLLGFNDRKNAEPTLDELLTSLADIQERFAKASASRATPKP